MLWISTVALPGLKAREGGVMQFSPGGGGADYVRWLLDFRA